MRTVRLASPELGDEEQAAVARVLRSGMLVQGREVEAFERSVAERCGRGFGVAVSSGTAALELALRVLGIEGGEVLMPDVSWPSPAHAACLVGATPALLDVHPGEWNAGASDFARGRSASTRAAVVIDQFGVPSRHREIAAALPGIPIIEDAACAIGSTLDGQPCGSFGLVSCLSLHPRKVITTGEGGLCLTDDPRLADALRILRNHGQVTAGVFERPGPNLRLTEMQAAMGLVQLERLDAIVERRRAVATAYRAALPDQAPGLATQALPEGATRNEQTFGVVLPPPFGAADRDALIAAMKARGVEAGRLSYAMHTLPSLRAARTEAAYPHADALVARGLALPLHTRMDDEDVAQVLQALADAWGAMLDSGPVSS